MGEGLYDAHEQRRSPEMPKVGAKTPTHHVSQRISVILKSKNRIFSFLFYSIPLIFGAFFRPPPKKKLRG